MFGGGGLKCRSHETSAAISFSWLISEVRLGSAGVPCGSPTSLEAKVSEPSRSGEESNLARIGPRAEEVD